MTNYIHIPFPQDLYDKIVLRSGGTLDPVSLAVDQVEQFVDRNKFDPIHWTDDGIEAFYADERAADTAKDTGEPSRGYQWQNLFLPNGTELRMQYKAKYAYARVEHEQIHHSGRAFSPSQWASFVADNTQRNAWRDIWVRFPHSNTWHLAQTLRDGQNEPLSKHF